MRNKLKAEVSEPQEAEDTPHIAPGPRSLASGCHMRDTEWPFELDWHSPRHELAKKGSLYGLLSHSSVSGYAGFDPVSSTQ